MFGQTSSERHVAFREMSLSAVAGGDNTPVVVRRCVFLPAHVRADRHAAFREMSLSAVAGGDNTPVVVRRCVFFPAHVRADV